MTIVIIILTIVIVLVIIANIFYNTAIVKPKKLKPHESEIINKTIDQYKEWWKEQDFQEVTITSDDGLKLVAYYLKASNTSDKTVIFAHGHKSKAEEVGCFAEYYLSKGFNVFIPDSRTYGKSMGNVLGMGWLERLDYKLWINKVIELSVPNVKILLHGISMGGSIVMMVSGEELPENVKCIIEDSGYSNIRDVYKSQLKLHYGLPSFPIIQIANLICKLRAGYYFSDADPLEQISKSNLPILFIHGKKDTKIPVSMACDLYENYKNDKELLIVKNAKHAEGFFVNKEKYINAVEKFYERYV